MVKRVLEALESAVEIHEKNHEFNLVILESNQMSWSHGEVLA